MGLGVSTTLMEEGGVIENPPLRNEAFGVNSCFGKKK